MKNYNEIVSIAREVARDGLRLEKVNVIRCSMLSLENDIKDVENAILGQQKEIARAEFAKTTVDPKDPDAEAKLKDMDERIDSANKMIVRYTEILKAHTDNKANLEAQIEKVQSGEIKVSMEALNANADAILKEITIACAVDKAKE